jgi:hypothetical protein
MEGKEASCLAVSIGGNNKAGRATDPLQEGNIPRLPINGVLIW